MLRPQGVREFLRSVESLQTEQGGILRQEPASASALGYAYAVSGDRPKAERILHELAELAKRRFVSPEEYVRVYAGLGEKDRVLDLLDQCYENRDGLCWFLKVSRIFDPFRREPCFQALVKKVGLEK